MYRLQWSLDLKMCPIRELGVVILEGVFCMELGTRRCVLISKFSQPRHVLWHHFSVSHNTHFFNDR